MLDLIILSLGFMIHMWTLPYSFKNVLVDSIVSLVQLGFGITILAYISPGALPPTPVGLITGAGVGAACFGFQLLYNRGVRVTRADMTRGYFLSQLLILLFFIPAEEVFYRGVFFSRLEAIWGPFTAVVIATALSSMTAIVSSRKRLLWTGSAVLGVLCGLGYYYSQSIWAPVLIHIGNDVGFEALNEPRRLFQ
jgi:membrane protease YdiL (CAAX protease family)